ncbi:MAG TPA: LysM peptidoglycan-binding domain-containing protein [Myxococcaceae bacterium]|nr:LysM peptidoglycan-binding domain-containing protein [Myxococcaceae bacterium]
MHTVKAGETLKSIAEEKGVSEQAIKSNKVNEELFKRTKKDELRPGDKLFVPDTVNLTPGIASVFRVDEVKRIPGITKVTPDIGVNIIENVSRGEFPFRPDLGKGGSSWFTIEGNPHIGIEPAKSVRVEAELILPKNPVIIGKAELAALYKQEYGVFMKDAETRYKAFNKIADTKPLKGKQLKGFQYWVKGAVESRMWDRVGELVARSKSKVAVVEVGPGNFSEKGAGKFAVVADRTKIFLKNNSPTALLKELEAQGIKAEPVTQEAAQELAKRQKWVGRVQTVFRYGGRILIVVAIAADAYKIYYARDKTKAVVEVAGGWAGATVAGGAFATWASPSLATGPWGWVAYGLGTVAAGVVGYTVGSKTTRYIYELVLEE